jgi:redox-sensitive bicupin YhaK (pirin superfamily)
MIDIRPFSTLFHAEVDWLDTRLHFSFSDYYDESHMNWATLRVFNDDRIAPESGFPPHRHDHMEIVTYVLEGELTHRDSLGNVGVLKPGIIQRMSAGNGITHAEFNASEKPLHLFQMWVVPEKRNIEASWEEKKVELDKAKNKWICIVSPSPTKGELRIHQQAAFHVAKVDDGKKIQFTPTYSHQYLVVAEGNGTLNGKPIQEGDAAAIHREEELTLIARDSMHVVLWDLADELQSK